MNRQGIEIPLEVYHGVPKGWYARDLVPLHKRLGGTYPIHGPEATEPGAPSFMPERYEWLQYRETLYRVVAGIAAKDLACIEIAVRFLELHHIGSYSGYIRTKLACRLCQVELSPEHQRRLHCHFVNMVIREQRCLEFVDYIKLWKRCITEGHIDQLRTTLEKLTNGQAKAEWIVSRLRSS